MLDAFDGCRRDQGHWLSEMNSVHGTDSLDHFKQAGILAYWLRRRVVIESVSFVDNPQGVGYVSPLQETFAQHANEVCSFLLGLHFCIRYEFDPALHSLEADSLTEDYIDTMGTLLKRKEVSPHALYLIYKSLFLAWPLRQKA